ncbi:hypothetical protein B0H14DRAFT_3784445 [Mycena olivaceomarginata]|nr:hypothetical protein B0H14DRAFT_3784445 [Mycena olivaceomarginata]
MQKKFKYFARFEGAWPLHDLARKALQNCVRARKADEAAEKLAEEIDNSAKYERQDTRAHSKGKSQPEIASREEEEEEEGLDSDSDPDSDAQSHYGSDTADDSMEEEKEEEEEDQEAPPSPPKSRAKQVILAEVFDLDGLTEPLAQVAVKNTARSKVQTDDETESPTHKSVLVSKQAVSVLRTTKSMEEDTERAPAPGLKKAATAKNNKENTSPTKRKSGAREEEDDHEEPSRKKLKAADPPVGCASNNKPKITVLRISAKCPRNGCDEALPGLPGTNLTPYLQRLFEERQIQLDTPDKSRRTIKELEGRICARIRLENRRRQVVQHGRQMGWPLSLDLMAMVTFILGLETEILDLVTKAPELGCCVVFFGRDGLKNFAPAQVYSRAGYFGPKGKDVIIDTMARIFAPHFPQLKRHLVTTLSSIISSNSESFDAPAQGTLPEILSIYDFMDFVLLPHVTARMISDDMQVSLEDAQEIRTRSIEFGQLVYWDLQDPALLAVQEFNKAAAADEIARIRMQALSSPTRQYALRPNPDYDNDESPVATKVELEFSLLTALIPAFRSPEACKRK